MKPFPVSFFDKNFKIVYPNSKTQINSVNKAIKFVKMGKVKSANKVIKPAIDYLIKKKCKTWYVFWR